MELTNAPLMKTTYKITAAAACLLAAWSCVQETDPATIDTSTRISLSKEIEIFNADGKTESGKDAYEAIVTIISVIQIGQCRHIIVVSIDAPAANFCSFSTFVCQAYYITILIKITCIICIAIHIFSRKFQVFCNRNSYTYIVNFLAKAVIYIVVRYISINIA